MSEHATTPAGETTPPRRDGLITAEQASSWAGRALTADELDRLSEAIPHSSIPDAIGTIVASWD